jgi:hypothetical protein
MFMRLVLGLLTAVSLGTLAQALATTGEPPASSALQTTVAPTGSIPAPAMTEAAATAPGAVSSAAQATGTPASANSAAAKVSLKPGDNQAAAQLKQLKAAGYTPEVHGSEIWFCRKEMIIGTRFDKKICNTADQLQHIAADARQSTDHIQRRISGDPRMPLAERLNNQ